MRIAGLPVLPTVLGLVLGYLVESNYRRSLVLSGGDHGIFIEDGIAFALLVIAGAFIVGSFGARAWRFARELKAAHAA
jgi:putative tricarboxylic transport membrane protein